MQLIMNRRISQILLLAYLLALALPAFFMPGLGISGTKGSVYYGYEMLFSLPFAMLTIAWWANPLWLFGLYHLFQGNRRWSFRCGLLATILACSVFLFGVTPPDTVHLSQFYPGFYVWIACMFGEFVASFQLKSHDDKKQPSSTEDW